MSEDASVFLNELSGDPQNHWTQRSRRSSAYEYDEDYEIDEEDAGGDNDDDDDFLDTYNLTPRQRLVRDLRRSYAKLGYHYSTLPRWQRALVIVAALCGLTLGILLLVFYVPMLHWLVGTSNELRAKRRTSFILILLIFVVSFPPLIGFSFLGTSTGLIYGVSFQGWIILALGSISGSIAAFALFKTLLRSKAERLVHSSPRFEAFAAILQENHSYWILALVRLCPFPYSITNGAVAAVHGLSLRNFSIAQFITTPKLFIYLFVGSRIKSMGESNSTGSKLFDLASIIITGIVVTLTAWVLYYKTKAKYAELQRQQQQHERHQSPVPTDSEFEI